LYSPGVRALVAILIASVAALAASANAAVDVPQVTVIGDSVLTAVEWNAEPRAVLQDGYAMHLEIGICRRLTGESCPFEGVRVPTLLDVVESLGPELGKVVLVEVGYNDDYDTFAQNVETSVDALLAVGVRHILWANLHGSSRQVLDMNRVLDTAASKHPELTIIDWNGYAGDHWSWFQGDSIHLVHDGAMAMAALFHAALERVIDPLTISTAALPVARAGKPYAARFVPHGGAGPYSWRIVAGALPKDLRLRPDGSIDGVARHDRNVRIVVQVTDSRGLTATRSELLRVASAH
jgi:hypothetical protein